MTYPVQLNLKKGMHLYKYELCAHIGRGHFGEVWKAIDNTLNRVCALKILKSDASISDKLREAQIGSSLDHHNLVRVHYADVIRFFEQDLVVIAMDLLPNGSANDMANLKGFIPLPDTIGITIDVLKGLEHLHTNHFFHNDIKPGNILFGSQGQAMLSDYGITGVSPDGSPVAVPGSYQFHKAPEVDDTGDVGVGTDVFQVGMTLLRLVSGLAILETKKCGSWDEYSADVANGKLISKSDFPPHVPQAIRRIVIKAISPNPADRYQSALEMRRQLERLHFPGFWTVDADVKMLGEDAKSYYRYENLHIDGSRCETNCISISKRTKHPRRVVRFCKKGIHEHAAKKIINQFINFVVTGR